MSNSAAYDADDDESWEDMKRRERSKEILSTHELLKEMHKSIIDIDVTAELPRRPDGARTYFQAVALWGHQGIEQTPLELQLLNDFIGHCQCHRGYNNALILEYIQQSFSHAMRREVKFSLLGKSSPYLIVSNYRPYVKPTTD